MLSEISSALAARCTIVKEKITKLEDEKKELLAECQQEVSRMGLGDGLPQQIEVLKGELDKEIAATLAKYKSVAASLDEAKAEDLETEMSANKSDLKAMIADKLTGVAAIGAESTKACGTFRKAAFYIIL